MSNCVAFKSDLVLDSKDIDVDGFLGMVSLVSDLTEAPEDAFGSCAWWYLSGNIERLGDTIIIHLGQSRSSHTFRDLRAMLHNCIAQFIKVNRDITLIVMDCENPQDGWGRWTLKLDGGD